MAALPDTFMPDGPLRRQRDVPAHFTEALPENKVRRAVFRVAAVGALAAAAGLWLVPVVPGDALMQVFKLAFSALLAMGGVAGVTRSRGQHGPEVQIDTHGRRLTVIERDATGHVRSECSYAVDGLKEIVLRDNMLTARDAQGSTLIALPVKAPLVRAALMRVLSQGHV